MKLRSKLDRRSAKSDPPRGEGTWGTIADAILEACAARERRALCVTSADRSGCLFVENQHVVHAEYGADVGLTALVELLRAGPVRLSAWSGAWPTRYTVHLGPVALLASRAVPGAPPPLPVKPENDARSKPAAAPEPPRYDYAAEERTQLWDRWASLTPPSAGAANDFRASGVFQRSAAAQPAQAAPRPLGPRDPALTTARDSSSESKVARLAGPLTELGLADVLQMLQWLGRGAVIRITRDGIESHLWCASGAIIDAESGRLRGEAAVYRALNFERGVLTAELRPAARRRTIFASTQRLILEAARRRDVSVPLWRVLVDEHRLYRWVDEKRALGRRPEELEVLQSFATPRTAHVALQASGLGDFETLRLLARWVQSGHLVPVAGGTKQAP